MTSSNTPVNKDTHVEELQETPHIVSLGTGRGSIRIDINRVSARESSRLWDVIIRSSKKQDCSDELLPIISDIVAKQTSCCSVDELLEAGNIEELRVFVAHVVKYTMKLHKPILQRHPELFRDAPKETTEQY